MFSVWMDLKKSFCWLSKLSNHDIFRKRIWIKEARSENRLERDILWSEIGSGFKEPAAHPYQEFAGVSRGKKTILSWKQLFHLRPGAQDVRIWVLNYNHVIFWELVWFVFMMRWELWFMLGFILGYYQRLKRPSSDLHRLVLPLFSLATQGE